MSLRVLVASNHSIIRDGLVELLRNRRALDASGTELDQRRHGRNGASVILCVLEPRPDVATVISGLEETYPDVPVLCLFLAQDDAAVIAALRAGVRGVIDDTFSADHLVESIQQCAAGQFVMSKSLATRLAQQYAAGRGSSHVAGPEGDLTHREMEVLSLLAEGCTNRDIAARLCLSEHTVRAHLRAIMQKLQVTNRVQAATLAWQSQLPQRRLARGGVQHANSGR